MSDATTSFRVVTHLDTPIILGDGFLTLDALLAALLFAEHGDPQRAHAEVPLLRAGSVYAGSAGFVSDQAMKAKAHFKRSIDMREMARYPFVATGKGRNAHKEMNNPSVDQVRDDYKQSIDTYTAVYAERMEWFGVGDAQRVRDLLERGLVGVGRKVRQGWGRVSGVDVEDISDDLSLCRTYQGRAIPMRPIPEHEWIDMGHSIASCITGQSAFSLPYFSAPRVRCVLPPTRQIFWLY